MNGIENINWENYPIKGYGVEFIVSDMEYICVRRYRRHGYNTIYNRISAKGPYRYYLLGTDNQIVELVRTDLFVLMKNSKIRVKNLKLSSDDKIYFTKEYQNELERRASDFVNFRTEVKEAEKIEKLRLNTQAKETDDIQNEGKVYEEEIRKGMILIVKKTTWGIHYPINEKYKENIRHGMMPDGLYVDGQNVEEHILEVKDCYNKLYSHIHKAGGCDWNPYLYDNRIEIHYKAEIGKFIMRPYKGLLSLTTELGIKQWIKDIESCSSRVDKIRNNLGWWQHKGVIGKILGAY